ncbi:hypothetical protein AX17_002142 [Amanita inopinata Kibby_2008]|nr:hypothetical protein AX17_002142 [Amanita inopinata Kibby_2008]
MASSSKSTTTSALTIAGLTLVSGLVAYAVYFDYKRRNDVNFRKKLRKEKKRVDKVVAESKESTGSSDSKEISPEVLREALEQLKNEESPQSSEEKEAYFMSQVGIGEQLATQGPDFHLPAALSFFRALRVYPSPVELIMIYQKTVPEPVFKIIMELTNLNVSNPPSPSPGNSGLPEDVDEETSPTRGSPPSETSSQEWDRVTDPGVQTPPVKAQVEGYYNHFPPKSTNVSVEPRPVPDSKTTRNVLVLNQDIKAGEVIYKEYPIVATLDADLEAAGVYCSQCLRALDSENVVKPPESSNPLNSTYCSEACLSTAKAQSYSLLFTLDSPFPPELPAGPLLPSALETRKAVQAKFVEHIKGDDRAAPLLVAKFFARQVGIETNKMVEAAKAAAPGASQTGGSLTKGENDFTEAEGGEYLLADHLERLRYLEVQPNPDEVKLLAQILEAALPGLEQFVTEDRHATLIGKMSYNAYGVYYDGGRDDKPQPTKRPEDLEKMRIVVGTQRQIGSAMYTVSSYLTHSCSPNARVAFPAGTFQLHLIAERDLKKGDELTVAFVDVTQHEGESALECRKRRRVELARGWRFACPCSRCEEEGKELAASGAGEVSTSSTGEEKGKAVDGEDVSQDLKDESKVEPSLSRFEAAQQKEKEMGDAE